MKLLYHPAKKNYFNSYIGNDVNKDLKYDL